MGKLRLFEIEFDHPQGVFHAGTSVRGKVIIDLSEPMKMRSISILITGTGKVKYRKESGDSYVNYGAGEDYVQTSGVLYGSERDTKLWFFGKGKVHWHKTSGGSKNRKTTHYRAEEIYFDSQVLVIGSDLRLWLFGKSKVHWEKRSGGKNHHVTHFRAEEIYINTEQIMYGEGVKLWFCGKAHVHWLKELQSGKHSETIHYSSKEVYVDKRMKLYGKSADGETIHPAGHHVYPFEFSLNETLPSSFEGEHGYVRYFCKATIDKPWKFDHEVKHPFTVLSILDLNREPGDLMSPMKGQERVEVSCCCCVSGDVQATFQIDRRGFVPGENIYINAEVVNNSNTSVSGTRIALKQYTEFYGQSDSLFSSGQLKPKCESAVVAQKAMGEIAENSTCKWDNVPVRIPAIPPSRLVGCNIINIAYVIKFYVDTNYGDNIKLASDLVIGTVPLRSGPPPGVVLDQPLPSAPAPEYASASAPPPPSYEESVMGRRNIGEDHDNQYTRGKLDWAPHYPTYSIDYTSYQGAANQV